ncbi:MAG: DNA polymerase III, partial [Gammaproteobacteria bacterium]
MQLRNSEIADKFDRLADLLEIDGANPFRVRAYRNAALTIRGHPVPMGELLAQGEDLTRLPGIGQDLANKIRTIVETGELPLLKELEHRVPPALADLLLVKGLGPKRVKALYDHLQIRSAEDLKRAIRNGRIRELRGFGARTEQLISEQLKRLAHREQRLKLAEAEEIATPLVAYLERVRGVKQVTVAGSFRRRRETVGDLDILVTASHGSPVMARFVRYPEVAEVVSRGKTRSTVRLRGGLQVDLRVVPQVSYGAALVYFTGSKAHNIAIRTLAAKRDLKINEYGVYHGERRKAGKTEA